MPIEVQGPDGSVIEFPDGTPATVMKRAMANKFGGPKNPVAPKPTTRAKGPSPLDKFGGPLEDVMLSAVTGRKQAQTSRERGYQKAKVRDEASKGSKLKNSKFDRSFIAGLNRGAFSAADILAAGVTAPFTDRSFSEQLDENRGGTDYELEQSDTGNFLGQLASGIVSGGAVVKGFNAASKAIQGARAAPTAVKAVAKAVGGLTQAKKGEKAKNLGKLIVSGGAGGAAYSAGEGTDISTGAAIGAAGGPAFIGLGKSAAYLTRPFRDMLGATKAPALLKRFTKSTVEDMSAAANRFRQETGAEPTLFEILPLEDRKRLITEVVGNSAGTNEATANAVRGRISNVGPEMAATANRATAPGRQPIIEGMAEDLAQARSLGGAANPEPNRGILPGGYGSDRSPADLNEFMRGEANARMASVENSPAAESLRDIFPTSLRRNEAGEIEEVFSDPEVNAAVISAAKGLRLRLSPDNAEADIAGLTAGDLTRVLRGLAQVGPGTPNKAAALRAEQRIMDYIERTNPEASQAVQQMRDNWAKRNRMFEGMNEGARTRTRESVSQIDREFRNAYETLEGATGRFLGQSNKLKRDFSGTSREAAQNIEKIAQSGETQAALRQNLGELPQEALTAAAQAQERSVRALAGLNKEKAPNVDTMDLGDLSTIALSLSPSAMIRTKAWAVSRILQAAPKIPEKRAMELVELLFSQNRATNQKAISLLNRAGPQGQEAMNAIARGFMAGNVSSRVGTELSAPVDTGQAQAAEMPQTDEAGLTGTVTDETPAQDQEYDSYDAVLSDWEVNADPALLDLIDRQFQQESGNQQFGPDGQPLQSSAGALGIAQVMPGTAPEAAELAGLEWDEEAYRTDPAYNKLLGIAYMEEMLRRFDGDVELALAAYNAGPGAVQKAGGIPNYAETQDYVARITGGR